MTHTDPVCGMQVEEKEAAGKSDYNGEQFYFCCDDCKSEFERNPDQYAKRKSA
jgi:YHS domain-containing protein